MGGVSCRHPIYFFLANFGATKIFYSMDAPWRYADIQSIKLWNSNSVVKYQNIVCAFFGGIELSDFYDKARYSASLRKILNHEVLYFNRKSCFSVAQSKRRMHNSPIKSSYVHCDIRCFDRVLYIRTFDRKLALSIFLSNEHYLSTHLYSQWFLP